MTNAETQVGAGSPVTAVLTAAGLRLEPGVVDGAGLAQVPGPLLTADIVDGSGALVATVAVYDDPDGQPDALLQDLANAALGEAGPGAAVQPADPVGGGSELVPRYTLPLGVVAFGDGSRVRALHASTSDRRGGVGGGGGGAGAGGGAAAVGGAGAGVIGPLDKLYNVSLDVSVELGRTKVTLADVLDYDVGSVVELDRAAGAPVDIRVNGTMLAQGEVVLIDDEYAVRITAIFDPKQGG